MGILAQRAGAPSELDLKQHIHSGTKGPAPPQQPLDRLLDVILGLDCSSEVTDRLMGQGVADLIYRGDGNTPDHDPKP
jgi:hypothetical protein